MDLTIPSSAQAYLTGLDSIQTRQAKAQAQISSGLRLQNVSDDPTSIESIYRLNSQIASTQQTITNLNEASSEVSTADTALQTATQALESAISLGAQGANSLQTAQDRQNIAQQVAGVLQTLISVSATQVNGRYIFGGDQDSVAPYQADSTSATGVQQASTGAATRSILDVNGLPIAVAKTAQEIFDARDANGNPTSANVFSAVNSLLAALQNNDSTGIANAQTALHAADDYLNQQVAFYGDVENRLTAASDLSQKFLTSEQTNLGQLQDADVPSAALALTQATTQQQAALSVEAKLQQQPDLFSFLG